MAELYRPGGLSPRDGGDSGDGPNYTPLIPDELKTRTQLRRLHKGQRKLRFRAMMGWFILGMTAIVIAFAVNVFFSIVPVDGESMLPTLISGERLLVNRLAFMFGEEPKRMDVVICRYPGYTETFVKRVIGKPGETVEVVDGVAKVNGVPVTTELVTANDDMEAVTVPDDAVFVMGDNRRNSKDSRNPLVGPIPHEEILGRVTAIVWPLDSVRLFDKYN